MKKVIERIVKSPGSPDTNDLWLDDNLSLKVYDNEEWKSISGGSGGGSGCNCPTFLSVEGEYDSNTRLFFPNSGQPSASEAIEAISNGGFVTIRFSDLQDGDNWISYPEAYGEQDGIINISFRNGIFWTDPIFSYGNVSESGGVKYFVADQSALRIGQIATLFDAGKRVAISYNDGDNVVTDLIVEHGGSGESEYLLSENGVYWHPDAG